MMTQPGAAVIPGKPRGRIEVRVVASMLRVVASMFRVVASMFRVVAAMFRIVAPMWRRIDRRLSTET